MYRYAGDKRWEDCGQPGQCRRLFGLASFGGGLYVTAEDGRCYVYAGDRNWCECGLRHHAGEQRGGRRSESYFGHHCYGGTIPRAEVFRYNPLVAPDVPVEALPP